MGKVCSGHSMAVRNTAAVETVAVGNWNKQVEPCMPLPGGGAGKVTHQSVTRGRLRQ
jgi:hypothetical protein